MVKSIKNVQHIDNNGTSFRHQQVPLALFIQCWSPICS